jgi:hypothetical protein
MNTEAADLTMALAGFGANKSGIGLGQAEYRFNRIPVR